MKRQGLTPKKKKKLMEMHGNRCINCGSPDNIEWHHVVPLALGGNDNLSNMVPLCYECHKAVTTQQPLIIASCGRQVNRGGRKRKKPEGCDTIADDIIYCRITMQEAAKKLGLSEKYCKSIREKWWFKEYQDKLGIKYSANWLSKSRKAGLYDGRRIGYIEYRDGRKEDICYVDPNPEPYMGNVYEDGNDTLNSQHRPEPVMEYLRNHRMKSNQSAQSPGKLIPWRQWAEM